MRKRGIKILRDRCKIPHNPPARAALRGWSGSPVVRYDPGRPTIAWGRRTMSDAIGQNTEQIPTLELDEDAPSTAAPPPLPAPLFPADGRTYKVDSSRATLGELRRDAGVGLGILGILITKVLRVRLPGSVNDPNVQTLRPFLVPQSAIPQDVWNRMLPLAGQLAAAG